MRVLLTGATGYLGHATARALAAAGHTVTGFQRGATAVPGVQAIVHGDVTDALAVRDAVRECDAVVHLAAHVARVDRPRGIHDRINVAGTQTVLREAARRGVRAVYASSFLALGPSAHDAVADELGPFVATPQPETPYAASKRQSLLAARRLGSDCVIVAPGTLYGPGPEREANYVGALVRRLLAGGLPGVPGGGRTRLTWAFVDDVAHGHVAALERGERGALYILGGPVASVAEFVGVAARVAQVKAPTRALPLGMLQAVGAGAEWVDALTAGRVAAPLTRAEVATYGADWAYDSRRAIDALGYRMTPLEDGVRATVAALRATPPRATPPAASPAERPRPAVRPATRPVAKRTD